MYIVIEDRARPRVILWPRSLYAVAREPFCESRYKSIFQRVCVCVWALAYISRRGEIFRSSYTVVRIYIYVKFARINVYARYGYRRGRYCGVEGIGGPDKDSRAIALSLGARACARACDGGLKRPAEQLLSAAAAAAAPLMSVRPAVQSVLVLHHHSRRPFKTSLRACRGLFARRRITHTQVHVVRRPTAFIRRRVRRVHTRRASLYTPLSLSFSLSAFVARCVYVYRRRRARV